MTDIQKEETTPDQLMKHFQGSSLKSIIVFTVVVHIVLISGFSFPFLYKTFVGGNTEEMSEKDRIDAAMREATVALREIAEEYDLKPQDLSSQLAGNAPRAPKAAKEPKAESPPKASPDAATPENPKSAIEQEISKKATGPTLPKPVDDEEDLFK